jgi:regulatory protein
MPTITDLKALKPRGGLTEVWIDGEPRLRITPDTVVEFRLRRGNALDEGAVSQIRASDERLRARQALARYTALALRSARQARLYLRRRKFDPEAIDAAVTRGIERDWLNDRRYAEAFVRQESALHRSGPARIAAKLETQGIDRDTAQAAIDAFGPDMQAQQANAERAARKRLAGWLRRGDRGTARKKMRAFLARQGYRGDIGDNVVETLLGNDAEQWEPE